jgi:hypothetical protein
MRCPAASTNSPSGFTPEGSRAKEGPMNATVRTLSCCEAAYLAGLLDGEGTITLSRRHAHDNRQLVVTIVSTELGLLTFALQAIGAGKITRKRVAQQHHAPSFTYCIANRQALASLAQIAPYLRSYKRVRAELILCHYLRLTPRNGKYSRQLMDERGAFEDAVLAVRAHTRTGNPKAKLPT